MHVRAKSRVILPRMNRKSRIKPQRSDQAEVIKSIRFTITMAHDIESQRGEQDFSMFVRKAVEKVLYTPEEQKLNEAREWLKMRGITPEMLIK